jgi:hypothetical protein
MSGRCLALILLLVGCSGSSNHSPDLAGPRFGGSWSGSLSHPATTCSDGSTKAAFATTTSWQINQSDLGLFLIWPDRCPATANIAFRLDAAGAARQQGDPATCIDTSAAQATMANGVMTIAADTLTATIDETEHDSGAQARDCEYPLSLMMTRS